MPSPQIPQGTGLNPSSKPNDLTKLFQDVASGIDGLKKDKKEDKKPTNVSKNMTDDAYMSFNDMPSITKAGFLLLHNDLVSLRKVISEGSSNFSSSSDSSSSLDTIKSILLAVAAGGIGAILIKAIKDASPTDVGNSLSTTIDNVTKNVDWNSISSDSGVISSVTEGVKAFIPAYFTAMSAAMAAGGVIETLGTALGTGLSNFGNSILGKDDNIKENKVLTKLQSIIDTVSTSDDVISTDDFTSGGEHYEDVKESIGKIVPKFVSAYFIAMSTSLVVGDLAEELAISIGTSIKDGVLSIFSKDSKKTDNKVIKKLKDIVDTIAVDDNIINEKDYIITEGVAGNKYEDVKKSVGDMVPKFISAYFIAMASSIAVEDITKALSSNVGSYVSSFIGGLKGKEYTNNVIDSLRTIIDAVSTSKDVINVNDYTTPEGEYYDEIKVGLQKVIPSMVISYFKALGSTMVAGDSVKSITGAAGEAIGNFFAGIIGLDSKNPITTKLQSIVQSVSDNIKNEEIIESLNNDSDALNNIKQSIADMIPIHFANLMSIFQEGSASTEVSRYKGQALGNFLKGFFSAWSSNQTSNSSFVTTITSVVNTLTSDTYLKSDEVVNYLLKDKNFNVTQVVGDSMGDAIHGYIVSIFERLGSDIIDISNKKQTTSSSIFKSQLNILYNAIIDTTVDVLTDYTSAANIDISQKDKYIYKDKTLYVNTIQKYESATVNQLMGKLTAGVMNTDSSMFTLTSDEVSLLKTSFINGLNFEYDTTSGGVNISYNISSELTETNTNIAAVKESLESFITKLETYLLNIEKIAAEKGITFVSSPSESQNENF